jgi:hypothetical protein
VAEFAFSHYQNDRQAGKPLFDVAYYGFRVCGFVFALQQNRCD